MTILEAICAAVEEGTLRQPFTAKDLVAGLRDSYYSYGSLAASLERYSGRGVTQAEPPLRRVGRGQYRLAPPRRKASP